MAETGRSVVERCSARKLRKTAQVLSDSVLSEAGSVCFSAEKIRQKNVNTSPISLLGLFLPFSKFHAVLTLSNM